MYFVNSRPASFVARQLATARRSAASFCILRYRQHGLGDHRCQASVHEGALSIKGAELSGLSL